MAQPEHRLRRSADSDQPQHLRRSSSRVSWRPRLVEGNPSTVRRALGRAAKPPKLQWHKRLFDLVFGSALIVFLAPLMFIIAALVKRDGGPVLYGHWRVGADRERFRCWKFRSMVVDADKVLAEVLGADPEARAQWERDFKLRSDPRITSIGRFLRTTSLDELPQLFNVLTGEMSLIGPRPIVVEEIERYGDAFRHYCACRPGMTGLWQVSGRTGVDYVRRVKFDEQYATSWSFLLDLAVLCRTVVVVTQRSGAY
ncbi:MAG TPA: sugar transferase [Stellaceae bacterium]|nr:sugar transferase [Stellaceae bacterium]